MAVRSKNQHGQYFTPAAVAELMIGMLAAGPRSPVLEPSAGAGVFLDGLANAGYEQVSAVEIDPALAVHSTYRVDHGSFVSWDPQRQFAAVIGNPPYIRWRDLSTQSRDEVARHRLWGTLFNSLSDYLTVFIALAVEHLVDGGELVFITPSFWMHTQHTNPLREWLLERGFFTDVVSFGEASVFPDVASAIVIFRYVKADRSGPDIRFTQYLGKRRVPTDGLWLSDRTMFRVSAIPQFRSGRHWTLASAQQQRRADEFEVRCAAQVGEPPVCLGDLADIANGMVSGLDKAFRVPEDFVAGLNSKERAAMLPVVKSFGLERGWAPVTSYYIDIPVGLPVDEVAHDYPVFFQALLPNQNQLENRYSYGRDLPFWEWAFRRSESFFLNGVRKAVVPGKERLTSRSEVRFALAPPGAVTTQDVTAFAAKVGTRESLEYIVAFLTLPQVSEWVRLRGLMKGGIAEFSERPLAAIPIRPIRWDDPREVDLHDRITDLMIRGPIDAAGGSDAALAQVHQLLSGLKGVGSRR